MKRTPLVSIVFLCSLMFAFCISEAPKSFAQSNESPFGIRNETQSLEIVGLENANGLYKLSIKNNSTRVVRALILAPDRVAYVALDFLYSDIEPGIPPSGVYQAHLDVPKSGAKDVSIIGVVFEDGSSEGDPNWTGVVKSTWLGMAIQYQKIKGYLEDIPIGANGEISDQALDVAISQLSSLPESSSNALLEIPFDQDSRKRAVMNRVGSPLQNGALQGGLHDVKELAIREIQKLRKMAEPSNGLMKQSVGAPSRSIALSKIKNRFERDNSLRERLIEPSANRGGK